MHIVILPTMSVKIETSWKVALTTEFDKEYFKTLTAFVRNEYQTTTVFPPPKLVFNAFNSCPFEKVSVVILGQDPYHGAGQAHGLSFSVPDGIRTPPSLQNIYKEIATDIGGDIPQHGNLEHWAHQGVLLLNATLTVRASNAGSHQGHGWETFTDSVITTLSEQKEHLVFLLWGNFARSKKSFIDINKHLVLESPHPSPFSAHSGFFGSKHFSKANAYLEENGRKPVHWI